MVNIDYNRKRRHETKVLFKLFCCCCHCCCCCCCCCCWSSEKQGGPHFPILFDVSMAEIKRIYIQSLTTDGRNGACFYCFVRQPVLSSSLLLLLLFSLLPPSSCVASSSKSRTQKRWRAHCTIIMNAIQLHFKKIYIFIAIIFVCVYIIYTLSY